MFVPRGCSPRLNAISGCLENRTRKKAIWFSFSVAYSAILVWWEEQGCRLPSQSTYQVQGQVMSSVWQWNCGQRGLHRQRKASLLERACAPWFWSEPGEFEELAVWSRMNLYSTYRSQNLAKQQTLKLRTTQSYNERIMLDITARGPEAVGRRYYFQQIGGFSETSKMGLFWKICKCVKCEKGPKMTILDWF